MKTRCDGVEYWNRPQGQAGCRVPEPDSMGTRRDQKFTIGTEVDSLKFRSAAAIIAKPHVFAAGHQFPDRRRVGRGDKRETVRMVTNHRHTEFGSQHLGAGVTRPEPSGPVGSIPSPSDPNITYLLAIISQISDSSTIRAVMLTCPFSASSKAKVVSQ